MRGSGVRRTGQAACKIESQLTGHMIGDFWVIAVVKGATPGHEYHGQGTFGYDSRKKKYVGTWIDSMADYIWHYEGDRRRKQTSAELQRAQPA